MKKRRICISLVLVLLLICALILLILFTQHQSVYSKQITGSNYLSNRTIPAISIDKNIPVNTITIGDIIYNDTHYQLRCYEINPDKNKRVLLTGSVHGEEPAGAYALTDIINQAKKYSEKNKDITIDVIPIMNPWGFTTDVRYNYNGINIGVDFTSRKSGEAKAIIDYVRTQKYDCVIDLHESQIRYNFFVTYEKNDMLFLKSIIDDLENEGYPIFNNPTMKIFRNMYHERGISYYPKAAALLQRISSRETLFVWLLNRGKSKKVYVFESGSRLPLQVRKQLDITVVEKILDKLSEGK